MASSSECMVCLRVIKSNQHAVECSRCCSWIHKGCSGLSNVEFEKVRTLAKKSGSHNWACKSCGRSEVKRISIGGCEYQTAHTDIISDNQMMNSVPNMMKDLDDNALLNLPSSGRLPSTSSICEVKEKISVLSTKSNVTNSDVILLLAKMFDILNEQRNDIHVVLNEIKNAHQNKIEVLQNEIIDLKNCLKVAENRIDNFASNERIVHNGSDNVQPHSNSIYDSEILYVELQDRVKKENNIIVHGIPECRSQDTKERIAHDIAKINEIFSKIDVSVRDFKAYRLGRSSNKTRPLRIIMSSKEEVARCMKNRRLLSGTNFKINADLTIIQREMIKKAYKELESRKENGESDLVVKFVNGIPKVVALKIKTTTESVNSKNDL